DRVGLRVLAGQRVPVGDEIEAVVPVLELRPVLERSDKMPEMEFPGRTHPADDARFHSSHRSSRTSAGEMIVKSTPVSISPYRIMNPYGRRRSNRLAAGPVNRPARTFPPSSGGIGI